MDRDESVLDIEATIEDIQYSPQMCKEDFNRYTIEYLGSGDAFSDSSFIIDYQGKEYGFSYWVSPKRTRSYPRARVYDTYDFKNRVTVIPLVKDEGKGGDRDYLQWDTISLMSLLDVYVIIGYYSSAEKNPDYENKITNQAFDYGYIKDQFLDLSSYNSDALDWNLRQISQLDHISEKAERYYYDKISSSTGVEMKSHDAFTRKMEKISDRAEEFKKHSRGLARQAQNRESVTIQPKEKTQKGVGKATITIKDYLGGEYYFTVDEVILKQDTLFLIEKKHTSGVFPSLNDIKNRVVLMVLFSNLDKIEVDGKEYSYKPVLGITGKKFPGYCSNNQYIENNIGDISKNQKAKIEKILNEGNKNNFDVYIVSSENEQKESQIISQLN